MAIQSTASDKLAQQRLAANTPMSCPRCGSIFFYRVDCAQYSNVGYGSAEFKMLTPVPQFVLICLCGRVMKPATAPTAAVGTVASTFYQSVVVADSYQSKAETNGIKQSLAQDFVGTAEFNGMVSTVDHNMALLQEQIAHLEETIAAGIAVTPAESDETVVTTDEVTHDGKPVKPTGPKKGK